MILRSASAQRRAVIQAKQERVLRDLYDIWRTHRGTPRSVCLPHLEPAFAAIAPVSPATADDIADGIRAHRREAIAAARLLHPNPTVLHALEDQLRNLPSCDTRWLMAEAAGRLLAVADTSQRSEIMSLLLTVIEEGMADPNNGSHSNFENEKRAVMVLEAMNLQDEPERNQRVLAILVPLLRQRDNRAVRLRAAHLIARLTRTDAEHQRLAAETLAEAHAEAVEAEREEQQARAAQQLSLIRDCGIALSPDQADWIRHLPAASTQAQDSATARWLVSTLIAQCAKFPRRSLRLQSAELVRDLLPCLNRAALSEMLEQLAEVANEGNEGQESRNFVLKILQGISQYSETQANFWANWLLRLWETEASPKQRQYALRILGKIMGFVRVPETFDAILQQFHAERTHLTESQSDSSVHRAMQHSQEAGMRWFDSPQFAAGAVSDLAQGWRPDG